LLALSDKQAEALTGYDSKDRTTMANGRLDHHDDSTPTDIDPDEAITGFTQGMVGNCASIATIKAAMVKYGEDPADVFRDVKMDGQGWKITMRDGFQLHLSFAENKTAGEKSDFHELRSESMWKSANFIYAAMAKRACMEGNDGKFAMSYEEALDSLGDGEFNDEAFHWIGISNYQRIHKGSLPYVDAAVVWEFVPGDSKSHSMFSGEGEKDRYGKNDGTSAKDLVNIIETFAIV
jgi:hypothetical protein